MFEQSLVESTHRVGTRKPMTMLASFAVQAVILFVVAIIPLIFYNVLPTTQMMAFLSAPPPPPPPPPPPAPVPKIVVHRLVSEVTQTNQLLAPTKIPHDIERVVESAPPPPAMTGQIGGDASGVIGGMLNNLPKAAPPPPPPPPAPVAVGGSVQEASCISCPKPEYPNLARSAHITGTVVLHAIIGIDGKVKSLDVVSGNAMLSPEAKRTVSQWKFQPLVLDGKAMEVDTQITVNFTLGGG